MPTSPTPETGDELVMTSFRVHRHQKKALDIAASITGKSQAVLMREAIQEYTDAILELFRHFRQVTPLSHPNTPTCFAVLPKEGSQWFILTEQEFRNTTGILTGPLRIEGLQPSPAAISTEGSVV